MLRKISRGIVHLHDYIRCHPAASTQELLDHFGWGTFDLPPYSPDLLSSHLLFCREKFRSGKRLKVTENTVTT
ncbi:hypothetical protein TNCV_3028261 [Trichonephila clavipes]|nr:hypothetical protein TNCV_3028261 [Trichonephila clavipes]